MTKKLSRFVWMSSNSTQMKFPTSANNKNNLIHSTLNAKVALLHMGSVSKPWLVASQFNLIYLLSHSFFFTRTPDSDNTNTIMPINAKMLITIRLFSSAVRLGHQFGFLKIDTQKKTKMKDIYVSARPCYGNNDFKINERSICYSGNLAIY